MTEEETTSVLKRVVPIYCGACGMPPEYCEYGPDFESHCLPWLIKNEPELHILLKEKRGNDARVAQVEATIPTEPWTTEERLVAFYKEYMPEKVDGVAALLEKYAGKEEKLFEALVKKYGPEPEDPFFNADNEEQDVTDEMDNLNITEKKKRRGVGAKKATVVDTRVIIQKIARNRKKAVTIVVGMDTVAGVNLKDVSKAFSKRFAGSSSVKDGVKGKEIIIQGDHMDDVAEMVVSKFKVPGDCVFLDVDGEFVPFE
jgi:density-regulated protein DRP1